MKSYQDLIDIITLKKLSSNTFLGKNYPTAWKRVFGGQLVSQSLFAAYETVAKHLQVHSLHGFFVNGGSIDTPITYKVKNLRDSRNFSYRSVSAHQNNETIFTSNFSFHKHETGVHHQIELPNVLTPDLLLTDLQQAKPLEKIHPHRYHRLIKMHPHIFEFRPVGKALFLETSKSAPKAHVWFRLKHELSTPFSMHQLFLAFVSDYHLLLTTTLPHRESLRVFRTFYATLDHSIWFHRRFRIDQWSLLDIESPTASHGRGFVRAHVFAQNGELIASLAQEGLIRPYKP
ncbi:MAG: thioesterase family protein [Flavobacteriaceae bacterium]|nr:thioesterase family protein [Flavobacteriaceae bacterium]MCY4267078.1 thioesterase family protein [Flavobacteriaceae bacterium]MCY4299552.1 thioesterase family protein [Flavobacteriaceae bacterium]